MEESDDHAATSHTERVTEGHGTTALVQLVLGNTENVDAVEGLGGESLVDLKGVNVLQVEAGSLEGGGDGVGGTNTHDSGRNTSDGEADDAAEDLGTELDSDVTAGKKDARSTIGDLRGVTGGGGTFYVTLKF